MHDLSVPRHNLHVGALTPNMKVCHVSYGNQNRQLNM